MSVLYIKEQGAYVKKCGERLVVEKQKKCILDIPVAMIDNIALIGNVQITTQMHNFLLEKGVDVSYFSPGGKYLGHSCGENSRNIFLRLAQYEQYNDYDLRMQMAQRIVRNKVENQIAIIRNFRWTGMDYDWKKDEKQLCVQKENLQNMKTINEVLGVEGLCSNVYFKTYGQMFKSEFSFLGRNRRPPKDPINVILSLGYSFLTREVSEALEAESFEMYLGFLHGLRYGRKSLALDIVEEFRQPVIDRLTLRLFNKKMLGKSEFEIEGGRVILTDGGFEKFCKEYECWMADKEKASGGVSFRKQIRKQAVALKNSVQKKERYQPFCWRK